jgi:hypothetical protein
VCQRAGPRENDFAISIAFGDEGREGARDGTCQPWIELGRLALADEGGKVLCEGHSLRTIPHKHRDLVVFLKPRCDSGGLPVGGVEPKRLRAWLNLQNVPIRIFS